MDMVAPVVYRPAAYCGTPSNPSGNFDPAKVSACSYRLPITVRQAENKPRRDRNPGDFPAKAARNPFKEHPQRKVFPWSLCRAEQLASRRRQDAAGQGFTSPRSGLLSDLSPSSKTGPGCLGCPGCPVTTSESSRQNIAAGWWVCACPGPGICIEASVVRRLDVRYVIKTHLMLFRHASRHVCYVIKTPHPTRVCIITRQTSEVVSPPLLSADSAHRYQKSPHPRYFPLTQHTEVASPPLLSADSAHRSCLTPATFR
ncbi:hypothetical protein Bbelb_327840 [Branchiostoma belcheri]|nr:hypothetical protein Bbelb_327840 [Branchiostoma belcheri]